MSLNNTNAVIVDGIRTPMGRSKGGSFRRVRADDRWVQPRALQKAGLATMCIGPGQGIATVLERDRGAGQG